ncbi:MAG: epoxyqueuosine reductase QueH [Muribaculaceae bacterium]|nr:epoxyqueuosine reductase QueH [Muribaculaceae bacterium]MCF0214302.1 epoxyqueuosine reductase QueH [Muribaculaceae bacterium]
MILHTCCAPCSSAILEWLTNNGIRPVVFFYNPNIYPQEEYLKRKEECARYAASLGLEMVDGDYDYAAWRCAVTGLENEPERGRRCSQCFLMRLRATAELAHSRGDKVIATTLASSRWKDIDQINAAGRLAVADYPDVEFMERNWRKGGLYERRAAIIREQNFYRQPYCGCEFSMRHDVPTAK